MSVIPPHVNGRPYAEKQTEEQIKCDKNSIITTISTYRFSFMSDTRQSHEAEHSERTSKNIKTDFQVKKKTQKSNVSSLIGQPSLKNNVIACLVNNV